MIKAEREARIQAILDEVGIASIQEIAKRLGQTSAVTVRRDIARLAAQGLVRRSHGGAAAPQARPPVPKAAPPPDSPANLDGVGAIVLPPLEGSGAETLRLMARRRRIPFLAESAPQEGGVYLGPDNHAAGRDLGRLAGAELNGRIKAAKILIVSLEALPNTRLRSDAFLEGFRSSFKGDVRHWRVDGRGAFKSALRASLDALQAHPDINVLFGVNDHSILAALEASERLGRDRVHAFSVGGEGAALFEVLSTGGKLRACAALFPEFVGARAVEVLGLALAGGAMPREVKTPHAILTPSTLGKYYRRAEEGWAFASDSLAGLAAAEALPKFSGQRPTIGFVPHYPAHDWYRNMQRAMQRRADELGLALRVAAPETGIAREIQALRRVIARAAAAMIKPGDTVLINQGETSLYLAEELRAAQNLTIVTNALDVVDRLNGRPGLKVILTGGELQTKDRCLVGPSLGGLFETIRVDKAFLSVDGVTARFGPSAADERLALAGRRCAEAAREVVVMADHSLIGQDASHRIVPPDGVDDIITDSGSLPSHRFALASTGARVTLADEETRESSGQASGTPARSSSEPGRSDNLKPWEETYA